MNTVEQTVRDYLISQLDEIPVYVKVPENPPAAFVQMQRTGTHRKNIAIVDVQLTLDIIGESYTDTLEIAERVAIALSKFDDNNHVWLPSDGFVGGPTFNPDPTLEVPRFTVTVAVRAAAT